MRAIHNLQQGSPAWLRYRQTHFNASEAGAMLNVSPYVSRSDLVRAAALGIEREITPTEQKLFDNGHAAEAHHRERAARIIGEPLSALVASLEVDGLPLSASFDGVATTTEAETWEHKSRNKDLVAAIERGEIPEYIRAQMEQGLLILGARRCLLTVGDANEDGPFIWYKSDPALRARIIAGWKQFQADVANYRHVETPAPAIPAPIKDLPIPAVTVKGDLSVASNLDRFDVELRDYIAHMPKSPETDQEFADLEAGCKALQRAQDALEAAKASALAQVLTVDELCRTIDSLADLARKTRLSTEKLVVARKDAIRAEIRAAGLSAIAAHMQMLDERLGARYMPTLTGNFAEAMRGKKTVKGLRDAVDAEVARVKIEANAIADRIAINVRLLAKEAAGREALFADVQTLVLKANDDFANAVKARLEADDKRQAETRERIRAEEEAKARTAAAAELAAPVAVARPPLAMVASGRIKPTRPSDVEIVDVLAVHYTVDRAQVIAWLTEFDAKALRLVQTQ